PQDFDYESHEEMMSEYLAVLRRRSVKWSKLLHGNVKVEKNIKGQREGCAFKHFTRCCTSSAALALFFLPPSCLLSPLNCLCLSSPSFSHPPTHTHTHARTHAHTCACRMRTDTDSKTKDTQTLSVCTGTHT